MDKKLKVGLIGANVNNGWSPRAHIPALLGLKSVDLVAVCTAHPETARESAEEFGVPLAFSNHHEMLQREEIDAIGVSVRVPKHLGLTLDVLEAGKHVYTEWPLGANLAEAEQMAGLAQEKKLLTMVGLQGRCAAELLRLKELIDEGYVGEVLTVNMTSFTDGVLSRTSDRIWQKDVELGANTLTIAFGHVIDALCMCLGEFSEVSAAVKTRVPQWIDSDTGRMVDVTSPDNILVNGTLQSGGLVSVHVSAVPWHSSGYRLLIYGRDGTLLLERNDYPHLGEMQLRGAQGTDQQLEDLPIPSRLMSEVGTVPAGPPTNVAQMWQRFAKGIHSISRVEPDFETAVVRHQLLDAIQRASDTGERQLLQS